jgi:hypothetical protein
MHRCFDKYRSMISITGTPFAAPHCKHFSRTSRPLPVGRFRRTDAPAIVHPVAKTKAEETVRQKAVTLGPHPEEENS